VAAPLQATQLVFISRPLIFKFSSTSVVNKDWTCKDKDKDQAYKDKDKDLTHKDQDKDLNLVLKEWTRTRTSLTVTYCKLQLNLQSLSSNNNEHKVKVHNMTVKPITACAVAQHCYNGDVTFLWENLEF